MRLRLTALALALPLALASCGSDDETDAAASASTSGSMSASASASPSASAAPTTDLVASPEFCDAIRAFNETEPTPLLQGGAPAEEIQQSFEQSVPRLDEAAAAAPEEARPAFESLSAYFVQLQDLLAEAGYDVNAVDQQRLTGLAPEATPEQQAEVEALVTQCQLDSAGPEGSVAPEAPEGSAAAPSATP